MKRTIIILLIVLFVSLSGLNVASTNTHTQDKNLVDYNSSNNYLLPEVNQKNSDSEDQYKSLSIDKNDIIFPTSELLGSVQNFEISFENPIIYESTDFSEIYVSECGYSVIGSAPMLPQRSITLTYEPGTTIIDLNFKPNSLYYETLSKPIVPAPEPYPVVTDYDIFDNQLEGRISTDSKIYNSNQYYPEDWFYYYTGMGLHPITDERVLFLIVHISPIKYNPIVNQIKFFNTASLTVTVEGPKSELNSNSNSNSRSNSESAPVGSTTRAVTHDMVIICPSVFKAELNDFAKHKTNTGVDTEIVTIEDINSGTYFTIQGRDQAEKIKYFIYDAIKEWQIKYVLLVGDVERVPTRITHVEESGLNDDEASDLYFADVFNSANTFCDWDYDADNAFGEYSGSNIDRADLFPDVHIGRFPASTSSEVSTLVDKTKTYEISAIGQPWYKNTVLCGLDTFSGGTPEGEYLSDYIARNYLQDFNNIKLYESTNTLTTQNIKSNWNNGAGFVSFSDHGLHSSWGNVFSSSDVSTLTNGYKLPFVNFDACLTGEFDQGSSDCIAEKTILNSNGGGVAVVASSRIAYGSWGVSHINSVSGYLNVRLYYNMKQTTQIAGALLTNAKIDYLRNVGSGGSTNFKTLVEYNYFGDPSLLLGGLPTAIYNLKCSENVSKINPGQSTVYTIQVENTDIQTRQIQLTTSSPPQKWAVKLSEKSLTLLPGTMKNVTLTVTAPDDALADSIGNIKVFGTLANIERNICIGTQTKINRIYGFEITSEGQTHSFGEIFPGNDINFTFKITNFGNAEEKIDLKLISNQEDTTLWKYKFSEQIVTLDAFSDTTGKVNIEVPNRAVSMDYYFNVSGKLQSNGNTKNFQILLFVERIYSVFINCSNPEQTTDPNKNLTFYVTLENSGNHLEEFKLLIKNMPTEWTVKFKKDNIVNDTIKVGPFSVLDVKGIISVPKGTLVGNYNLTLFALCGADEISSDECKSYSSVGLNINVNRVYGIELRSLNEEYNITPGKTIQKYIEVINLGNYRDFAVLEITNKPENWIVNLERYNDILLYANEKRDLSISITPGEKTIMGSYGVNIRGTVEGDGSYSDLKLVIKINRITGAEIINVEPENKYKPGEKWELKTVVKNLGNDNEKITLSIPTQFSFGEVKLRNSETIDLKPFGEKDLILDLILDEFATAGKHYIPISAKLNSLDENITINLEFEVLHIQGIELNVLKNKIESQPGEEVKVVLNIHNLGNSKDNFTLEVYNIPENWVKRFPEKQTLTLREFSERNFSLYFSIPEDEPYHDIDLEFRIQSRTDSKTNYILPVTISLEEEKFSLIEFEDESSMFLIIVVILVIIFLIVVGIVVQRRRRKRKEVDSKENIIRYSVSSDGSKVAWDESYEPTGDQFKPPTELPHGQVFELQVQAPQTYRRSIYSGSDLQNPNIQPTSLQQNQQQFIGQNYNYTESPIPIQMGGQYQTEEFNFKRPGRDDVQDENAQIIRTQPIVVPEATHPLFIESDQDVIFEEVELESDNVEYYDPEEDGLKLEFSKPTTQNDLHKSELSKKDLKNDTTEQTSGVKVFKHQEGFEFKKPQHYKNNL